MKGRRQRFVIAATLGLAAIAAAGAAAIWLPDYPAERLRPGAGTALVLTDRQGIPLRTVPGPHGRGGRWVSLSEVPPIAIVATLAAEDRRFFQHAGVDLRALARAGLDLLRHRRVVSGGSTLTMQLARTLAPHPRSITGKFGEMVDALRLERALDKHALLEQYLNRVSFGAGTVGIEAAAQRFFGKSAASLDRGEASLLAVLPRAPRRYDLRSQEGRTQALARRAHVLAVMESRGLLRRDERLAIAAIPLALQAERALPAAPSLAPHFTDWVLDELRQQEPPRGPTVRTTLDLDLQRQLEAGVRRHLNAAGETSTLDVGLVVLVPATGAVLAMIGAPDHAASDAGQVNITTTARHPGSALKPFLYALAIEGGATTASLADDSVAAVPGHRPARRPRERGPTRYREALAGSYNLGAMDVLEAVGPARLLERLRAAGLGPLKETGADYGLGLALGAGRVRLVDLAAAYGAFVNGGVVTRAHGVAGAHAPTTDIFSPEVSWLVLDMLADPGARRRVFGANLPLDLPFPVAAKTGTSAGFADTLAIAATREVVVAAWAGAFDGSGTDGRLAMWSAAPLVRLALQAVAARHGGHLTLPPRPSQVVAAEVCSITGAAPSAGCSRKREWFVAGTTPASPCAQHTE